MEENSRRNQAKWKAILIACEPWLATDACDDGIKRNLSTSSKDKNNELMSFVGHPNLNLHA